MIRDAFSMDETTCISRTVSGAAFGAATGANAAAAPRSREAMKSFIASICVGDPR